MNAMAAQMFLLVEDNPSDARLVQELLATGAADRTQVSHAQTLADAVRTLQEGRTYDAILLDLRLPDGEGVSCVEAMLSLAPGIPIIVLTGMEDDELAVACIAAGAQDFMPKADIGRDRLRRTIQYAITRSRDPARRMSITGLARLGPNDAAGPSAEEALAHYQTQNLQAIGRLAAGVAHHFNNLLTVVVGSIELALPRLIEEGDRARLKAALSATERGAGLTRQLLSFASLQMVRPEVIEPSHRLGDLVAKLREILPGDIDLVADVPEDLWSIEVDGNELDAAVLNLAFNARDAMSEGGRLTVSAANQAVHDECLGLAGRYVVIKVRDTGPGIAPEVLPRVFEPFFTTKDIGAGNGLGLSHAYGFARQAGGAMDIQSGEGAGATVRLFIPVLEAEPRA